MSVSGGPLGPEYDEVHPEHLCVGTQNPNERRMQVVVEEHPGLKRSVTVIVRPDFDGHMDQKAYELALCAALLELLEP